MRIPWAIMLTLIAAPLGAQDEGSKRSLERYDVRDLADQIQDFPGPFDPLPSKGAALKDHLVALFSAALASASKTELNGHLLEVHATAVEHETVNRVLRSLRNRPDEMVSVVIRFIETSEDLSPGKAGINASRLSSKEVDERLKGVLAGKGGRSVTAPRLTVFNAQRSHVTFASEMAYVSEYEVTFDKNGKGAPMPLIGMAKTGRFVSLRPLIVSSEKGEVLLEDLRIVLADRPAAVKKDETPLGVVEDPQVRSLKLQLSPSLSNGESLFVGPLTKPWCKEGDPKVWLLISCEIVKLAELEKRDK